MDYLDGIHDLVPTDPMGYVGSLKEIEDTIALSNNAVPNNNRRRNTTTQPRRKGKRRKRPRSAGRTRSKPTIQHQMFQGALRAKPRRQRPASAGRRRPRSLINSQSAPTFNVTAHPFVKPERRGSMSRKRYRLFEMKQKEQSWNSEFAQNLNDNRLVLATAQDQDENRRREWMNHNQDQFTALNELRRAILHKQAIEAQERNGGGRVIVRKEMQDRDLLANFKRQTSPKKKKKTMGSNNAGKFKIVKYKRPTSATRKKNKSSSASASASSSSSSSSSTSKDNGLTMMAGLSRMKTRKLKSPSAKHERQDCAQKEAQDTKEDLLVASQSAPSLTAEANDRATLEEMKFVKKCSTIRTLFDDLKIPMRDRKFFTKTFMSEFNDTNVNFINEQLNLLQSHRAHTLKVLSCIRRRETAIKQLYAVAQACVSGLKSSSSSSKKKKRPKKKKKNDSHKSNHESNASGGDLQAQNEAYLLAHYNTSVAESPASRVQIKRFRTILIDAARRAQDLSCQVVEAIVPWRKDFWRPHPFQWKNKNYLLRMGSFVGLQTFVVDQEFVKALQLCRLPKGCFDVLLPSDVCLELCTGGGEEEEEEGEGEGEGEGVLGEEGAVIGAGEGKTRESGSEKNGTRKISEPMKRRIQHAQQVIKKEMKLVQKLANELNHLLENGYFIPRLKWNPNKLTAPVNKKKKKKKKVVLVVKAMEEKEEEKFKVEETKAEGDEGKEEVRNDPDDRYADDW